LKPNVGISCRKLQIAIPVICPMRILHTADWHLGKKLHKHDLSQDHQRFISWLVELIEQRDIHLLLISGDVFDLANPSSEARTLYYQSLVKISGTGCRIVITGGNHDSPAVLNAPKEVLKALNIDVVGGMPENLLDVLIPVPSEENPQLVVAAIPFLRDGDIRQANAGISYGDRIESVKQGIANTYAKVLDTAIETYPETPLLAMGHLFTMGASTSDSERDIQIGNQAALDADHFSTQFESVVLGHIHKPQRVKSKIPIFYSGSPIPLSFSERKDGKRVLLMDTEMGFEPESIPVPVYRTLKKVKGSFALIQEGIGQLVPQHDLTTLIEVEVVEPNYNPELIYALDQFVFNFEKEGLEIVKHRISFEHQVEGTGNLFSMNEQLEDLKPREVFEKRLAAEDLDGTTRDLLLDAFYEILEGTAQV